jgi:hypothetical protein
MFNSVWSIAKKIALKLIPNIQYPNAKLNVGIFNENMASNKQVEFFTNLYTPEINTDVDSSYLKETGKGTLDVPFSSEYYTGEVL